MRKLLPILLFSASLAAKCLPMGEALKHIGDTACVAGKVRTVSESPNGAWFLNFCDDYRECPFSVVVFTRDLRDVGDVRFLAGKEIEIHGKIKEYQGRAEIILRDRRQLRGESAKLPPVPKDYDASRHGSYSAGKFKPNKSSQKPSKAKPPAARNPSDAESPAEEPAQPPK
jgi:exonuclease VII large subunit